jgi:hypothetical protein
MRGGGPGGFTTDGKASTQTLQLVSWLRSHQPGSRYLLAVQGSQQAGQYVLAGASVLPMGGFSGSVPFPSADQLASLVASGQLRYVLTGGDMGRGDNAAASWVTGNCTAVTAISGLYDCKKA